MAWATVGAALVGAAVVVGGGGWWLLVPALAPDLPLFFGAGAGAGLVHGQLHPRAVPAYNLMHRVIGPATVITAGLAVNEAGQGRAVLLAGLVWGAHVALDRACGYGLRTPAGFQR